MATKVEPSLHLGRSSSVSSVDSTTVKGLIRISGKEVWTIDPALFPIRGTIQQKLKFLLRYAILAPSQFNTQPWKFMVKSDKITLFCDRDRAMNVADPDDRAMMLSCGSLLHYLWLATRHFGYKGVLELFPNDTSGDAVATFELGAHDHEPSANEELLFNSILLSHTNKGTLHSNVPLSPDLVAKLVKEVEMTSDNLWVEVYASLKQRKKLARVVSMALDVQLQDRDYHNEITDYVHLHGTSNDGISGYRVNDPGLTTFGHNGGTAKTPLEIAEGSPTIMILGTRSDSSSDLVLCGMAMSRVTLLAAANGVAHSYLNQPMMYSKLRRKVAAVVEGVEDIEDPEDLADLTVNILPQVIFRLGFGEQVNDPTPRRSVKQMLIKNPPLQGQP